MSYHVVIEGIEGARRIRSGRLPRRGDWLKLHLAGEPWWLPVLEVVHFLSAETRPAEEDGEGEVAHERAEPLLVSSLAVGVRARRASQAECYKAVLPPSRWPLGGTMQGQGE